MSLAERCINQKRASRSKDKMDIVEQLKRDEGFRSKVYHDTLGIPTIGYGHNLEAHQQHIEECSEAQADAWLRKDLADATDEMVTHLPWTEKLDGPRFACLQNMWFNMGAKVLEFKHMLAFVKAGNYRAASIAMGESLWAKEVGVRAQRLEKQMYSGDWI